MPTVYFAKWLLLPDGTLVENGAVAVDGPLIRAAGTRSQVARRPGERAVNLGSLLLLPGLIDLHTHLEEAGLRGPTRDPDEPFSSWVVKKQARLRLMAPETVAAGVRLAARELLAQGTTCVLDTSRLGLSAGVLAGEPLRAWVQHELHADNVRDEEALLATAARRIADSPAPVRPALGPYAFYSLSPRTHRRTIHLAHEADCVWACHAAESAEELLAFSELSGDLYFHITRRRPWPFGEAAAGSMHYAITSNLVPTGAVLFHCNYVNGYELVLLAARQASVVCCPTYTETHGHKPFPLELALKRGIRVCVGSESVADTGPLSLFDELFRLRGSHPHLPARQILSWVTANPAAALGQAGHLGSLDAGRLADVIGVSVPHAAGRDLIEELLEEEPTVHFVLVNGEEVIVDY